MERRSEHARSYRRLYWTSEWKALRITQLRAEPHCRYCLQAGDKVPATVVDHVERHGGDPKRFWNGPFQSLCKLHHDAAKQSEETRGFSNEVDDNGWPVDPRHPGNSGRVPGGAVERWNPKRASTARVTLYAESRNEKGFC